MMYQATKPANQVISQTVEVIIACWGPACSALPRGGCSSSQFPILSPTGLGQKGMPALRLICAIHGSTIRARLSHGCVPIYDSGMSGSDPLVQIHPTRQEC